MYHANGSKEVFSSFSRFLLYNKGNTSPVENIAIEYNILIVPHGSDRAVQYRIRVNLLSKAGLRSKRPDMFIGPVNLLKMLGQPTGQVSIEYVDYAAARHFMTQIMEWYEALNFNTESKFLNWLQDVSHMFRAIVPVSFSTVALISGGHYLSTSYTDMSSSDVVSRLSFLAACAIFVWFIGILVGRSIERAVDRIQPISSVSLNKGDEKVLREWKKSNLVNTSIAVISALGAIGLNITASAIFEFTPLLLGWK